MRERIVLLAAALAAILALTACTGPGSGGAAPAQRDAPDRGGGDRGGGDHGGGGM